MKSRHILEILLGAMVMVALAAPASAMYHPTVGRWLQRDPEEYVDGMNTYSYCADRPTVQSDPSGMVIVLINGNAQLPIGGVKGAWHRPERDRYGLPTMRTLKTRIRAAGITDRSHVVNPEGSEAYDLVREAAMRNVKWNGLFNALAGIDPPCREPIVIIGYSDGATRLKLVAERLAKEFPEEFIDYVGIIDMTREELGWTIPGGNESTVIKHDWILSGDNFFQRNDWEDIIVDPQAPMGGRVYGWWNGMRIDSPNTVLNVSFTGLTDPATGKLYDHFHIDESEVVRDVIVRRAVQAWQKGAGDWSVTGHLRQALGGTGP